MRRRGTGRFVLAVVAMLAVYGRVFATALRLGDDALGALGLVAALVLLGFGLALLFTAIYDGPGSLGRLVARVGPKKGS